MRWTNLAGYRVFEQERRNPHAGLVGHRPGQMANLSDLCAALRLLPQPVSNKSRFADRQHQVIKGTVASKPTNHCALLENLRQEGWYRLILPSPPKPAFLQIQP